MTYLPLPTAYLWRRPDGTTITIDPAEIEVVYGGEDTAFCTAPECPDATLSRWHAHLSKGQKADRAFAAGTLGLTAPDPDLTTREQR